MSTVTEHRIEAVVARKAVEADGVVSLVLRSADGAALPAWHPGAHIDLIVDGVATRQYSLCGDPANTAEYRLAVLREDEGALSRHVFDALAEGDHVGIGGPRNHFRFVPAPRYRFVAGGIGITPMLPMILAAEAAGAQWELHYGGRSRSTMAFLPELAQYGDRIHVWAKDEGRRLDLGTVLANPEDDTLVYTCGPERLLSEIEDVMGATWPHGALHLERFAAKPLAEPERAGSFEIVLNKSGRILIVPPDRSILSVVEEAGIGVLSSCATGTCGTCDTPVLEGVPEHRDAVLTEDERAANDCMMICVSRSLSDRLVLGL